MLKHSNKESLQKMLDEYDVYIDLRSKPGKKIDKKTADKIFKAFGLGLFITKINGIQKLLNEK
jgi:predicted metal-dependent TIM-barrel fold hydrolase